MSNLDGDVIGNIGRELIVIPPLGYREPVHGTDEVALQLETGLSEWASKINLFEGQAGVVREQQVGRLAMLAFPETRGPEHTLLGAKMAATLFRIDDLLDQRSVDSDLARIGARLTRGTSVLEETFVPAMPEPFGPGVNPGPTGDDTDILSALERLISDVEELSVPDQVDRVRHEIAKLFLSFDAEVSWRQTGHMPTAQEYFTNRQLNGYLPHAALIDIIGGYELPPNTYTLRLVKRATKLAAATITMVNDLYSLPVDLDAELGHFNMPLLIRSRLHCPLPAAISLTVRLHNRIVEEQLGLTEKLKDEAAGPELLSYLDGLQAAMDANYAWHRVTRRYRQ